MNIMGLNNNKSFGSSASESSDSRIQVNPNERSRRMWHLLVQEARAVSLGSLLAMGWRISLFFLITATAMLEDSSNFSNEFRARLNVAMIWKEVATIACVVDLDILILSSMVVVPSFGLDPLQDGSTVTLERVSYQQGCLIQRFYGLSELFLLNESNSLVVQVRNDCSYQVFVHCILCGCHIETAVCDSKR